jgi:hypothetical protein
MNEPDAALAMYDFHARMYDPALGRFGSVDPQGQFASPYTGMGNNPVVGVDPDGELFFVPILIGALIGGAINVGVGIATGSIDFNKAGWGWNLAASFGIGAAAGAAAVIAPQLIGTIGNVALTTSTGAVASGFIPGAISGAAGGFVGGFGGSLYFGYDKHKTVFGNLLGSFGEGLMGSAAGSGIGGTLGLLSALPKGKNVFTGKELMDNQSQWSLRDAYRSVTRKANFSIGSPQIAPNQLSGEWDLNYTDNSAQYKIISSDVATSSWPAASGGRTFINGIEYTTHALERMQPVGTIMQGNTSFSRGIPPSVVENVIKYGSVTPGNTAGEVIRTFENVRVITNYQGNRVITVIKTAH